MHLKQVLQHIASVSACVLLSAVLSGCALLVKSRPVLIEESDPIRLGPGIVGRVYYINSEGKTILSDESAIIPEGWYAVPPELYRFMSESVNVE